MRFDRTLLAVAAVVAALPLIHAEDGDKLVETWLDSDYQQRQLERIIVVGIAGLTAERKQFEDKFLTHLRGRKIDGITSHSIVPHLDDVDDREALIRALHAKGIEGAITVRLVRLDE